MVGPLKVIILPLSFLHCHYSFLAYLLLFQCSSLLLLANSTTINADHHLHGYLIIINHKHVSPVEFFSCYNYPAALVIISYGMSKTGHFFLFVCVFVFTALFLLVPHLTQSVLLS